MPLAVTVHPSGAPPSNSACHATISSVPVPLTLSDSDERLKAAPNPSVAEFASPANAGVAPPPPVGGGEGAGVREGLGDAKTLPWPSSSHSTRAPLLALIHSTSACRSPLNSPTPTTCHGGEHPGPQVQERMVIAMTLPWPSNSHAPRTPLLAFDHSTSAYPSPLKSPTPTTCHGGEHPGHQVQARPGVAMTLPR